MANILQAIQARKLKHGSADHQRRLQAFECSATETAMRHLREGGTALDIAIREAAESAMRGSSLANATAISSLMPRALALESPRDTMRRESEQRRALEEILLNAQRDTQRIYDADRRDALAFRLSDVGLSDSYNLHRPSTGLDSFLNRSPQSSVRALDRTAGDRSGPDVPPLRNCEVLVLRALLDLGATDQQNCVKASVLAQRIHRRSKARLVDEAVSSLRKKDLVLCQRGPHGGTWLTHAGQRICASRFGHC